MFIIIIADDRIQPADLRCRNLTTAPKLFLSSGYTVKSLLTNNVNVMLHGVV